MGGDALTGHALIEVLTDIHKFPKRLQSNFVRDNAYEVARLASMGLITTRIGVLFGHSWRVTFAGLRVLELAEGGTDECATV